MKNVIIMGAPRSGTSMVSGLFSKTDYYMGEGQIPTNDENPKGYWETASINDLNESILAQLHPTAPWGLRWLAQTPTNIVLTPTVGICGSIMKHTKQSPYCFKDPRFCFTLPLWKMYAKDVVYICIFREPDKTAESIVKHIEVTRGMSLEYPEVFRAIYNLYEHILTLHTTTGLWYFVHYNELFDKQVISDLEKLAGVDLDASFPDLKYNRSKGNVEVPELNQSIYEELCKRADYRG